MAVNTEQSTDKWMGTAEAARYIGYSAYTLKVSRMKGVLGGKAAPKFYKPGSTVLYRKSDLDNWVTQSQEPCKE